MIADIRATRSIGQIGLVADLRCVLHQGPLWAGRAILTSHPAASKSRSTAVSLDGNERPLLKIYHLRCWPTPSERDTLAGGLA
jgi:hypothetical protein